MGGRGMIRLRYVNGFRDRLGVQRFYFRRSGKRVALPGIPGSREFMDAYAALLAEQPLPVERRAPAVPGSFAALAMRYYGSPNYLALGVTSRKKYRLVIDRFLGEHGHRLVSQMTRERVDTIIGRMAEKPGAGIVLLKRIRTLVRYAMDLGWIDRDPTARLKGFASTEIHTWSEEEIGTFEARWPTGTKQRLAFALMLYSGQRRSDVHRMTWQDVAGAKIRVVQHKTGKKLAIPLHPALQAILAVTGRENLAILCTMYGRPFTVDGFSMWMRRAITASGLPMKCQPHGLRKAAGRRLAEAGCTAHEIMSILGHDSLKEAERYTRAANQERLAERAIAKQSENTSRQTFPRAVANSSKEP